MPVTILPHDSECKCMRCLSNPPDLVATEYRTKSAKIIATRIKFDHGIWIVYYKMVPLSPKYETQENDTLWMTAANWNRYAGR